MKHKHDTPTGFTIVELLIVIVVIAVLAALTIAVFSSIRLRAQETAVQADLKTAAQQILNDKAITGNYPLTTSQVNEGKGLSSNGGTTYQYTSNGSMFCLTGTRTSLSTAFRISNDSPIERGVCIGHTDTQAGSIAQNTGTVTTFVGSTATGSADGAGNNARFFYPSGLAIDSAGNIYVADMFNQRIRKVSPSGVVTTLAGSSAGFADGQGAAARFNGPKKLAVGPDGSIYVADSGNERIRKISPTGMVTTLAGNGTTGSADGPGTSAQFSSPRDVDVDSSGNVYVVDSGSYRIRKISPSGEVSTFAGTGVKGMTDGTIATATFSYFNAITLANDGSIYVITDYTIRRISPSGDVTTPYGAASGYADGTGTAARFHNPDDITTGPDGKIYVGEMSNYRIRIISPGDIVTTLAGSGTLGYQDGSGTTAQFGAIKSMVLNSSNKMFVLDSSNHAIRKIE